MRNDILDRGIAFALFHRSGLIKAFDEPRQLAISLAGSLDEMRSDLVRVAMPVLHPALPETDQVKQAFCFLAMRQVALPSARLKAGLTVVDGRTFDHRLKPPQPEEIN